MFTLLFATWSGIGLAQTPPHLQHSVDFGVDRKPSFPVPAPLPAATPGPDSIVYGYQAYWDDDLNEVPWDELSHIAIFAAGAETDGSLSSTSRWDEVDTAVAMAAPYGVKVHLCVTNFSTSGLETLLGSTTARQNLIDNLVEWVADTGADGVNIDFEGLPSSRKQEMVDFISDLDAAVDEVVIAVPAVDWNGSWDFDELAKHSHMFIMAYAYHYSGSSEAGPNDPLYGGSPWGEKAIDWSIDDYINPTYGAPAAKVILGLPLYGFRWSVASNTVPAAATASGSAVFYAEAQDGAATYGEEWESNSETPYYFDGSRQCWYSNEASLQLRIEYALDQGLGGIGFWALHYDDSDADLWEMIRDETTIPPTDDPDDPDDPDPNDDDEDPEVVVSGDYLADAGLPFLAYVGDTIVLNGEASTGPAGQELQFAWTQVEGPSVTLDDVTSVNPQAVIEEVGTHAFELVVGDGVEVSESARTHIVVLDPNAGQRHAACGCTSSSAPIWLFWMAPLWLLRRREKDA
jgi:hypothetical protein